MRTSLVTVVALLMSCVVGALGTACVDATTIYEVEASSPVRDGAAGDGDAPETLSPDGADRDE